MTPAFMRNVGGFIAALTSVLPQAATAAVNGTAIDREAHNMPLSCLLQVAAGASTGSPSAVAVAAKLQHSPDNSTWTDYTPPGASAVASITALSAVNTQASVAIELSSAFRYIRPVVTPTLTGGTTPTLQVHADIILGGEFRNPAQ
jgi:hypothetical protein